MDSNNSLDGGEFHELHSPRSPRGHTIRHHGNSEEQFQIESQPTPPVARKKHLCNLLDVWALGIVIVIGGDFFSWNAALQSGFGSLVISTILTGTAYVALVLCTSETFSGLPFSGGAYGLVRVTFGFYAGFLIGCTESIEYIGYISLSALALMSLIRNLFPLKSFVFHLLLILFFFFASWIQTYKCRLFWRFNTILGLISFLTVLCYCFGTLKYTSIEKISGPKALLFAGGANGFLKSFPLSSWFFIGIESLSFASDATRNPQKNYSEGFNHLHNHPFFDGLVCIVCSKYFPTRTTSART